MSPVFWPPACCWSSLRLPPRSSPRSPNRSPRPTASIRGKIETIRYTWNIELPGGKTISHKWEWSPKTDTVSYEGKDKEGKPVKVSYQRSQLEQPKRCHQERNRSGIRQRSVLDAAPVPRLWDGATVTDDGQQKLPIGDGTAQRIVMKYPSEGGYQPGDTWDLYIGADKRIVEIVYHRGAPNPSHLVSATYTDYKKAGPLLFSIGSPGTGGREAPSGFPCRMCR